MARAASDSSKGYSYSKLCKQHHIDIGSTSKLRKKKYHEISSPPTSNVQGGRRHASRKIIVHKQKPLFKRTEPFTAPKGHSQKKVVICYRCGSHDGHIDPNCPTLKKHSRQDKEAKKKTQVFYRNKQGKINVLDIPDDFHQIEEIV